ncbi:tRNA-specific 2-thiouridylase MnmA [compost metagenome]
MDRNEVYVTTDLNDATLWKTNVQLGAVHWINEAPQAGIYQVRIRHRAPLINADLSHNNDTVSLKLHDEQRAVASGQSVVIYQDDICVGGGIIL